MEITFQNKLEDLDAFYDYLLRETEEGKRIGKIGYNNKLAWTIMCIMLASAVIWGSTGKGLVSLSIAVGFLVLTQLIVLVSTGFNPHYYFGKQIYKSQEKSLSPADLQALQSERTLIADDDWLEVRSSEALHRWQWGRVDQIVLSPNYVFINMGSCSAIYLPRRVFQSEQDFVAFGKSLAELKERHKNPQTDAK